MSASFQFGNNLFYYTVCIYIIARLLYYCLTLASFLHRHRIKKHQETTARIGNKIYYENPDLAFFVFSFFHDVLRLRHALDERYTIKLSD